MLGKLSIVLSSAILLSASAYATTASQIAANIEPILLAQDVECVTEVEALPTANDEVVYVTAEDACFDESDTILLGGVSYPIQYNPETGYYYVVYDNIAWYFVDWNGATLLTDGNTYVEVDFAE